jgi:hypothetical protein
MVRFLRCLLANNLVISVRRSSVPVRRSLPRLATVIATVAATVIATLGSLGTILRVVASRMSSMLMAAFPITRMCNFMGTGGMADVSDARAVGSLARFTAVIATVAIGSLGTLGTILR